MVFAEHSGGPVNPAFGGNVLQVRGSNGGGASWVVRCQGCEDEVRLDGGGGIGLGCGGVSVGMVLRVSVV